MEFRIADNFTDSLARLSGQEQKAVKTTAFDLQLDPTSPSLKLHRVERCRDPNFWSIRVSQDIRLIVHKTDASLLLCYVDHHDAAYQWAMRRKIERHPKTGAAQLVEIRERVEEISVPQPVEAALSDADRLLFADVDDDTLLGYGVPAEWIDDVRAVSENSLLDLVDHLPQEAAEALLELATGGKPRAISAAGDDPDPFAHPDAQRRFRLLCDAEELGRALDFPWDRWTTFLHPLQRDLVERTYDGPARISGSAGTGKTVVALHRAVTLARRYPDERVLLTTFWTSLANALSRKLDQLVGNDPAVRARITAAPLSGLATDLYGGQFGQAKVAHSGVIYDLLTDLADSDGEPVVGLSVLMDEWQGVIDAFQIRTWRDYRDFTPSDPRHRISAKRRKKLWTLFATVWDRLAERGLVTQAEIYGRLTAQFESGMESPFGHIVVDEAQDIGIAELRFLAAMGRTHPDSLFFASDLGQRIFRQPFSWAALGVDLRDRSHTLTINYRTSHQIRRKADRLLPGSLADVDGIEELRTGTISAFNGPLPRVQVCTDVESEISLVADWLRSVSARVEPGEIGLFVRSNDQLDRANLAVREAGLQAGSPTDSGERPDDAVSVCPMHQAKGLEFKAVVVMACDRHVLPLRSRIEAVDEAAELADIHNTERHLLYVACTRARDHLLITGVEPVSAFLADLIDDDAQAPTLLEP